MNSKVDKRRLEIMRIIQSEGEVNVLQMANLFNVTTETIRADFDFLSKEQGWERTHGGIRKKDQSKYNKNYFFHEREVVHMEEKKKICFKALELIADGDCIYIDSGSTVIYLLNYLNQKSNLTIVTHSIGFLMRYIMDGYEKMFKEQGHRFVFIGGEVDANMMMTYGTFFNQNIEELNYDHLIFSVDAFDSKLGGTNVDYQAYNTIKSLKKHAANKILLIDQSKFDLKATYNVISLEEIDCLITNAPISEEWVSVMEQKHVRYFAV